MVEREEDRNREVLQLARLKQLNPVEFDLVQRIAPGLLLKDREKIVSFLSLMKMEGFEIIERKSP